MDRVPCNIVQTHVLSDCGLFSTHSADALNHFAGAVSVSGNIAQKIVKFTKIDTPRLDETLSRSGVAERRHLAAPRCDFDDECPEGMKSGLALGSAIRMLEAQPGDAVNLSLADHQTESRSSRYEQ